MPSALADKKIILETTVPGRPAVADVLHEHLEEVAHLAIQWRKLLFSPEVPLRRLRSHAGRIEAHFDGLRVGGPASISMVREKLVADDPWVVHAAAWVWMEMSQPDVASLFEQLQNTPPELLGAWKETFRKLPPEFITRLIRDPSLESLPTGLREVATDALGWHGMLPSTTAAKLAEVPEPGVRRAVARHAVYPSLIARLLEDENVTVRRTALWSLLRQDPRAALERGRQMASSLQPDAFALRVIGLVGNGNDATALLSLVRQKTVAPAALLALRDLGRPQCAEALLEIMEGEDADLALVAMGVFESLAGKIPKPNPEQPLPTGISSARFHWQQVRKQVDLAKRFLHGQPFPWLGISTEEPMAWVWRRAVTANTGELAWLSREVPDGFFADLLTDEALPGE